MKKTMPDSGPDMSQIAPTLSHQSVSLISQTWQWISSNIFGIVVAAAIGTGIALLLLAGRSLACKLLRSSSGTTHWRTIFARVVSKTGFVFIILCSTILVGEHANTPPAVLRIIEFLFVIAATFQAAIWARELILGAVEHRVGGDASHSTLGSAIGIIRLLVSFALFAIALIVILDNLGVNVTGLVAGLGIGGIAIGLAAQGIFSDLFAALAIIFDRPFRRGDGIQFDDIRGNVEQIGIKTTRVRSVSGEEIIVSNAKLLEKQLHNFSNLERRRLTIALGLVYQTPPEVCAGVADMLREIVDRQDNASMIRCGMVGFGASSLDFELVFDVRSTDYEILFATRSAVCVEILRTFNEAGIQFAYPTQTSFTAAPDGTIIMPYPEVTMVATEDLQDKA